MSPDRNLTTPVGVKNVSFLAVLALVALVVSGCDALINPDDGVPVGPQPEVASVAAAAVSGVENDTVTVNFNDEMLADGSANAVDNLANYTIQSPIGTDLTLAGATTTLSAAGNPTVVTITLGDTGGGEDNLQYGNSLRVIVAGTVENVAGTDIVTSGGTTVRDATIGGDGTAPGVTGDASVIAGSPEQVQIVFDEIVEAVSAETEANYTVQTAGAAATTATLQGDRVTVVVEFAAALNVGTDTIDIAGVTDLAGNAATITGIAVVADIPNVTGVTATAVANEENDTITIEFDDDMVTGGGATAADNLGNYTIDSPNGNTLTLGAGTAISAAGSPTTVTITLGDTGGAADNLQYDDTFTVTVDTGVQNSAGFDFTSGGTATMGGNVGGDNTGPTVTAAQTDPSDDTLLRVTFDEAVNDTALTEANYAVWIGGSGGTRTTPTAVTRLSFTQVELDVGSSMTPGTDLLDVTLVEDLAGNVMTDVTGFGVTGTDFPNMTALTATAVSGAQNDTLVIEFEDDMVTGAGATSAEDLANYTIDSAASGTLTLTGSSIAAAGSPTTVTITLDIAGTDANLLYGDDITVTVAGTVENTAGTAFSVGGTDNLTDTVGGDGTGPTVTSATQVRAVDATGQTVDVVYNEAVAANAETVGNYTFNGIAAPGVTNATLQVDGVTVRLELDALAYPPSHTLSIVNVTDLAGNVLTGTFPMAIDSDDTTAPTVVSASAEVVATGGVVAIQFDDDMYEPAVTTAGNYTFECPTGTTVTLTNPGAYTAATRTVVFVVTTAISAGDAWTLAYNQSSLRDIAGNPLGTASSSGTVKGWAQVTTPLPGSIGTLHGVDCLDTSNAWLYADGGIYYSSNSGLNWSLSTTTTGPATSGFWWDTNTGWVCSGDSGTTADGYLYYTTNGGTNWSNVDVTALTGSSTDVDPVYVTMTSATNGYMVTNDSNSGDTQIWTTTDGGATWSGGATPYTPIGPPDVLISTEPTPVVVDSSSSTAWIAVYLVIDDPGGGPWDRELHLYYDEGTGWTDWGTLVTGNTPPRDMLMSNTALLLLHRSGAGQVSIRRADNPTSAMASFPVVHTVNTTEQGAMDTAGTSSVWMAGLNSTLQRSDDDGQNWTNLSLTLPAALWALRDISMESNDHGLAITGSAILRYGS